MILELVFTACFHFFLFLVGFSSGISSYVRDIFHTFLTWIWRLGVDLRAPAPQCNLGARAVLEVGLQVAGRAAGILAPTVFSAGPRTGPLEGPGGSMLEKKSRDTGGQVREPTVLRVLAPWAVFLEHLPLAGWSGGPRSNPYKLFPGLLCGSLCVCVGSEDYRTTSRSLAADVVSVTALMAGCRCRQQLAATAQRLRRICP